MPPEPAQAGWDARPERPPLGYIAFGPNRVQNTPLQILWMSTIGIVTQPVTLPWYVYVHARWGRERAYEELGRYVNWGPERSVPPGERRVPDIEYGSFHALVIGIEAYEDPAFRDLETPLNDARAVADVLREDYGFEVTVLENAGRGAIVRSLARLRSLGHTDNLLIYYAGHGLIDEVTAEGYWIPSNARFEDPTHWISVSTIRTAIRGIAAKHVLVVSDSCFAGALNRGERLAPPPARRKRSYYLRLVRSTTRRALTSGGLDPVTDRVGNDRHSVFAAQFLRVLRENPGIIEGSQLFSRLRRGVMQASDQSPQYATIPGVNDEGGDFLFVRQREPGDDPEPGAVGADARTIEAAGTSE